MTIKVDVSQIENTVNNPDNDYIVMLRTPDEYIKLQGIFTNTRNNYEVLEIIVIRSTIPTHFSRCCKKLKANNENKECNNKSENNCNYYYIGISFCCFLIVLCFIYIMFFMNKTKNNTESF